MKRTTSLSPKIVISSAMLLACAFPVWSQGTGFYVKTDLGGTLVQDTDLTEFFGPVAPGTKVKFDPGFRAGFTGGYQVTPWFAGEAEIGFMQNQIDFITGADRVHDTWFSNVPFLANAKFQFPNPSPLTPYIGAGVGFTESILSVDQISLGGTSLNGDLYDTEFAYQAFAGLRYRLNERMGLSVEYRYFAAEAPSWRADFTSGTATDTMRFGHTRTHIFSLAFDFRF
jgi:opacity protein-like surface antigen